MTANTTAPDVGRRLGAARLLRGLSQATVARRAGIAASYLSRVENGKVQPTYPTLMRIVRALRVDLGQVVGESDGGPTARRCPVSPDGRCLCELIRPQAEIWRDPHGEHYSARELQLIRSLALWLRAAKPERLRALEVLIEDLTRAALDPR
ncbi:MAG TPA: helix-turn-helix transcriptional regulator [Candidatus Polarisedimenticolaceae bacterium]|nr:helix-turn-helix transcriptional regulator [Candidatus Polarisedimenticolaceae bacterium]